MGTLLISSSYASPLLQAIDPALGPASQSVDGLLEPRSAASQGAFRLPLLPLVFPLRDHMPDPAPPQRSATLRIAVSLVARHLLRALPRSPSLPGYPDPVQGRLQLGTVMALSCRQHDRERASTPVEGEVQLGGEATAAPSERFVFAGLLAPPFWPPRSRPWPGRGGRQRRADAPVPRCCPPRRPPSRRVRRPALRPGASAGSAPRSHCAASAPAGRSRSGRDHTVPGGPARGRRCGGARECH